MKSTFDEDDFDEPESAYAADDEDLQDFLNEVSVGDDEPMADDEMDMSFLDEVSDGDDEPIADDEEEEFDLSFLDEDEDDSHDWFDQAPVETNDSEPDWMQALDDVDITDVAVEDDLDDIFDDADFDDALFESDDMEELDTPVADLDSLLATFDDVDDDDFADDDEGEFSDFDAVFDEAMRQDEVIEEDDFDGEIPEWLRDVDVSSDETSAVAIIRQGADIPIEALDERLQALREKALSISSDDHEELPSATPEILAGVTDILAVPHIPHDSEALVNEIRVTKTQDEQSKLLQSIVGVTITPSIERDEEGVPIVESARRQRRFKPECWSGTLVGRCADLAGDYFAVCVTIWFWCGFNATISICWQ